MILNYVLDKPCPICKNVGKYGNVNVTTDTLNRGCNNCGYWNPIPLPPVRKKVLYLDQFFQSHAFKKQEKPFVEAAERIQDLAAQQLLVCPYSSIHTEETHLWRHKEQERLYKFIKQTARGYEFNRPYKIKQSQIINSFKSFLASDEKFFFFKEREAFRDNIHSWDDYFWVDIKPVLGDIKKMREGKKAAVGALVEIFDEWRNSKSNFENARLSEALGYAKTIFKQYIDSFVVIATGGISEYLNSPIESKFVETLTYFDRDTLSWEQRIERIKRYLASPYFVNTPFMDISCQVFAVLRKLVKRGGFTNKERAKERLSGLYYDVEFISTFGPYCDAMFVDRVMRTWVLDPETKICNRYSFTVYSAECWNDFHNFLDDVERSITEELKVCLKMVYPRLPIND